MPLVRLNGADLHVETSGEGPETVVFAHGLLFSARMFDDPVRALEDRYRCVCFDFRGQGESPATEDGYDMDTLSRDAEALVESLGGPVHFVGLSMGGFVGMRLAARRPELVRSLVLIGTSGEPEPPENVPRYRRLAAVVRLLGSLGMRLVAGRVMAILFGRAFLADPARAAERRLWRERLMGVPVAGALRALDGVLTRDGVGAALGAIRCPTLVMVGDQDVATVPAKAEALRDRIPGARLLVVPRAGHSATIEEPRAVGAALRSFLASVSAGARAGAAT